MDDACGIKAGPGACRCRPFLNIRTVVWDRIVLAEFAGSAVREGASKRRNVLRSARPTRMAGTMAAGYTPRARHMREPRRSLAIALGPSLACLHAILCPQERDSPLKSAASKCGRVKRRRSTLRGAPHGTARPLFAFLLSRPNVDMAGGAFILVEERCCRQSRAEVVRPRQHEGVSFPVHHQSARGTRGPVASGCAVSRLRSGQQYAVAINFHDAK